jgi:hypothetical protein
VAGREKIDNVINFKSYNMKIVRVTYTAKAEYAEQNQKNIQAVMNDLQKLNHPGLFYFVSLSPDGKTFTHTAFFNTEEDNQVLLNLPAFKTFQEQLKASGPEAPPKQDNPTLVGASKNIFY